MTFETRLIWIASLNFVILCISCLRFYPPPAFFFIPLPSLQSNRYPVDLPPPTIPYYPPSKVVQSYVFDFNPIILVYPPTHSLPVPLLSTFKLFICRSCSFSSMSTFIWHLQWNTCFYSYTVDDASSLPSPSSLRYLLGFRSLPVFNNCKHNVNIPDRCTQSKPMIVGGSSTNSSH